MAQALKDNIAAYIAQHPDAATTFKVEVDALFPNQEPAPQHPNNGLEQLMESLAISKSAKLKRYEKGDNFSRFCDRFKEYVQLTGMKPEHQFSYFLQSVDDQTYAMLKSITVSDTQKLNVDEFCRLFIRAKYGDESFTLKNEVRDCKQSSDQNISDYVFKLREKANVAYSNPQEAEENCLLAFLRGIRNVDLRRKLNEATITTFAEAVKLAKKLERVENMFLNDSNPSSQVLNADQYNYVEEKPKRVTHSTNDDSTRSRYSQWDKPWQRRNRSRDYSSSRSRSRDRPTGEHRRHRSPTPYYSRDNRRSQYRSNSRENRRPYHRSNSRENRSTSRSRDNYRSRYRSNSRDNRQYRTSNYRGRYYDRSTSPRRGYQPSRRNSKSPIARDQCSNCGERGHWRRECPAAYVNKICCHDQINQSEQNFA